METIESEDYSQNIDMQFLLDLTQIVILFLVKFLVSIFKATPPKIEIAVTETDVKNIDFITLKLNGEISVAGVVNFDGEEKPEYHFI